MSPIPFVSKLHITDTRLTEKGICLCDCHRMDTCAEVHRCCGNEHLKYIDNDNMVDVDHLAKHNAKEWFARRRHPHKTYIIGGYHSG